MNYNIVETAYGKAIYVKSNQIADDMHYAEKNNIKSIIISQYENVYTLDNVNFLQHYPFVESITISMWESIDYSALQYLKNLKVLNINLLIVDKGEIDFNNFPNIEDIGIAWNNKRKNIASLQQIRILGITKYNQKDLQQFSSLVTLEKFILWQSSIKNLEGIENLTNLKHLSLFRNKNLTSLKGIEKLKNLTKLEIDGCKSINAINEISSLENLEVLKIDNCGDIESLKPIQHLKKLKELTFAESTNILDGDLSPCVGIQNVGFMKRKHYSHTYEELKK